MSEEVLAVDYEFEEVGKHVKGSKKRYIWKIQIKGQLHDIVCDTSLVSSKVKISVDGKAIYDSDVWAGNTFQHAFVFRECHCVIIQQGERFELRVNNKAFMHMLNQQKTSQAFKSMEDHVEDIKVTKNFAKSTESKVTLNISAMGEGMKKRK